MATSFASRVTVIAASWLNSVASLVEDVFASATTPAQARTAISVDSSAEVTAKDDAIYAAFASTDPGEGFHLVHYTKSAGEISSGVYIDSPQYPVGDIRRYGADPLGVDDIGVAVQAAVDAANQTTKSSRYIIFPPAEVGYNWATAVSLSFTADKSADITFIGHSDASRVDATAAIDMLTIENTVSNVRRVHFLNMYFNLSNTATAGLVLDTAAYCNVLGCQFINLGSGKGLVLDDTLGVRVANCWFFDGNGTCYGIYLDGEANNNNMVDNFFGENLGHGIYANGGASRRIFENTIAFNKFYGCDNNAITLVHADGNIIQGNHLRAIGNHGIEIYGSDNMITGNRIKDYGSGSATADKVGVFINTINSTASDNNRVTGNIFRDADNTASRIHVRIAASSGAATDNLIADNDFDNSATAISDAGTTTYKRNNLGYVTEAKGSQSVSSGTTARTVTHGLSQTPTHGDIWVTFSEQGDNDYGRWWISNITSTTFDVNVSANPGASNLDFEWGARCF